MRPRELNRRRFLQTAGAMVLGTAACRATDAPVPRASARSRIVLIRDREALTGEGGVNAPVLERMLDEAVASLTGADSPASAWRAIIGDAGKVGIKSNVWRFLPTPPELETALRDRILGAGVSGDRIPMDDRGARKTLVDCDILINARPLRTHYWAGIGGCIKNLITFSERPADWHEDGCADLGGLLQIPEVSGKPRLHVLVVLRPLFHGKGPHHYDPRHVWDYRGLIVSADPVAADAVGVRLLEAKRRLHFGEEIPFETHTKHVEYAETRHGAGVADRERIEIVRLGWEEDSLI